MNDFLEALWYYIKEPFIEVWNSRRDIFKTKTMMAICIVLMIYFYMVKSYENMGVMLVLFLFLHFYNRFISGDFRHIKREKVKEKIKDTK